MMSEPPRRPPAILAGYVLMLVAAAAGLFFVRRAGAGLSAPPPTGEPFGSAATAQQVDTLGHLLLALVVVIITARAVGWLFQRLAQPAVIGEIIAGILLGPSLLGRVAPDAYHFLLPSSVAPFLGALSQIGVVLYMFLVGLELDPKLLRNRGPSTVMIAHASILAPFVLGLGLAIWLYPRVSSSDVPFSGFALFFGVSMSVTAFPVLARILTDRRIHKTRTGIIALACAAIGDVTAWCLLAGVVAVVQARAAGAWRLPLVAAAFIAVMLFVVRPLMVRLALYYGKSGRLTQGVMALALVLLLLSALASEWIGIHAIFGAFLCGAITPHDSSLARELTDRLEDLVVVLFLPAFFAFTGMKTQIGLVSSSAEWVICGVVIAVASVGKIGGTFVAARLTGMKWRDGLALGVLMNTRGLMELIVLALGLELRLISPTLFAMMVLMALVTTFATAPLLQLITRRHPFEADAPPAPPPSRTTAAVPPPPRACGVLVPVANPAGVPSLIDLALAASRDGDPPPRVLALVRHPSGGVRSGLREAENREPPKAPALVAALDHARERGALVEGRAVWTEDPALDILSAANDPGIGWLLLGFHRPVFGSDLLGGVVKDVLERAAGSRLSIGVVVHGHERPIDRLFAVVDDSANGRAALELAARIAARRRVSLHVVLVPAPGKSEPAPALREVLREAGRPLSQAGLWLHTDVLPGRTPAHLSWKTQGDLVVIGADLVDELGLPLDEVPGGERCVVIVQGGRDDVAVAPAA
jgi:Kef-type K+ transport system membrane component KefB